MNSIIRKIMCELSESVSLVAVVTIFILAPEPAQAACKFIEGDHLMISYLISEPILVPLDAADGTLIKSLTSSGPNLRFECSASTDLHGVQSLTNEIPSNGIIPFGKTGLGYTLSSSGGVDDIYPANANPYVQYRLQDPYELKIYKIGRINTLEKIPAGEFALYMAGNVKIYTASLANDLAIAVGSCNLMAPSVDMGEYTASGFNGIGHASKEIDFSVMLTNCSGRISRISYKMTPSRGWLNAPEAVMALDAGSVSGLGIQIKREGVPIKADAENELTPPTGSSGSYSFTAAYYQVERHVGAGSANSSLTIEVSYL